MANNVSHAVPPSFAHNAIGGVPAFWQPSAASPMLQPMNPGEVQSTSSHQFPQHPNSQMMMPPIFNNTNGGPMMSMPNGFMPDCLQQPRPDGGLQQQRPGADCFQQPMMPFKQPRPDCFQQPMMPGSGQFTPFQFPDQQSQQMQSQFSPNFGGNPSQQQNATNRQQMSVSSPSITSSVDLMPPPSQNNNGIGAMPAASTPNHGTAMCMPPQFGAANQQQGQLSQPHSFPGPGGQPSPFMASPPCSAPLPAITPGACTSPVKNGGNNSANNSSMNLTTQQMMFMQQQQQQHHHQQMMLMAAQQQQQMMGPPGAPNFLLNGRPNQMLPPGFPQQPHPRAMFPPPKACVFNSEMANHAVMDKRFPSMADWHINCVPNRPSTSAAAIQEQQIAMFQHQQQMQLQQQQQNNQMQQSLNSGTPTAATAVPGRATKRRAQSQSNADLLMNGMSSPSYVNNLNSCNNFPMPQMQHPQQPNSVPPLSHDGMHQQGMPYSEGAPTPMSAPDSSTNMPGGEFKRPSSRAPGNNNYHLLSPGGGGNMGGKLNAIMEDDNPLKKMEMMISSNKTVCEPLSKMPRLSMSNNTNANQQENTSAADNKSKQEKLSKLAEIEKSLNNSSSDLCHQQQEQSPPQHPNGIRPPPHFMMNGGGPMMLPPGAIPPHNHFDPQQMAQMVRHPGMHPGMQHPAFFPAPGGPIPPQMQMHPQFMMRPQMCHPQQQQPQQGQSSPSFVPSGGMMPPPGVHPIGMMPPSQQQPPQGMGMPPRFPQGMGPPQQQQMQMPNGGPGFFPPAGMRMNGFPPQTPQNMEQIQMPPPNGMIRPQMGGLGEPFAPPSHWPSMTSQQMLPQSLANLDSRVPIQKMQYFPTTSTNGQQQTVSSTVPP